MRKASFHAPAATEVIFHRIIPLSGTSGLADWKTVVRTGAVATTIGKSATMLVKSEGSEVGVVPLIAES